MRTNFENLLMFVYGKKEGPVQIVLHRIAIFRKKAWRTIMLESIERAVAAYLAEYDALKTDEEKRIFEQEFAKLVDVSKRQDNGAPA